MNPLPARAATESSAAHLALLAFSIFLSAFLLFQVQPIISRWILPWFGGSTAVWTTCMLFFQIVLFCGYAYAHATFRWLGGRTQGWLHLALLALACALLPVIPSDTWKPADSSHPAALILGLLAATVGVPYFVLSSTGPLLQAWFANAFPGRSPYRLYALSNAGSLLALLSYPFLFEPLMGLHAQAWNWTAGFVILALAIASCAWIQMKHPGTQLESRAETASPPHELQVQAHAGPSLAARVAWVALPAFASVMLLATTNHVCQNIAVVPFLWVAPLSLYLLTFIICFDHARWYRRGMIALATAVFAFASAGARDIELIYNLSLVPELLLYLATMFGACLLCHGELVRLRPAPSHLTEFYLAMSGGGALGGLLVSFIAPRVFTSFFEWNLGLLGTICLAWCVLSHELANQVREPAAVERSTGSSRHYSAGGGVLALGFLPLWFAGQWQFAEAPTLVRSRNFYGVIRVQERYADDPARHHYTFRSGRVTHGKQFVSPEKRAIPLTYYGRHTGVGHALIAAGDRGPLRVAVVGLGTGTLATYARAGDHYRFYETNPAVVDVAKQWFTFLGDCQGTTELVEGDARLMLERESVPPYDVIVLDAFSGDTVPVHLLTQEAFTIYRKRLREGGLIAVNVDNNHLQISSEVERQADAQLLSRTRVFHPGDDEFDYRADWIIISADREFLRRLPSNVPAELLSLEAKIRTIPLWTDHYSNLASLLINR